MDYVVHTFGWMAIVEAPDIDDALDQARELAPGASLLPSDVQRSHVREATSADIEWYEAMTQPIKPPQRSREQKINAIITAAGGLKRVELDDSWPNLVLYDGRKLELHVHADDERIHWYLAGEEIT